MVQLGSCFISVISCITINLLLVAISVFLIRMMKKIDDAADKKREVSTKTAFKEALKEDRDEQRKKDIYEDKY